MVIVLLVASVITAGSAAQAVPDGAPPQVNAAAGAQIRVNQVGYPTAGPKRAYLMSPGAAPGAPFAVRDAAGTTVLTGTVGASLGSWSSGYAAVHPIDFDAVTTPGTYIITTSGAASATSPRVTVGSGASLYAQPIANTLSYYQVQRDGPDYIPSALRTAPGHLNDRDAMTYLTPRHNSSGRFSGDLTPTGVRVDASGGWADAGDYLKFLHGASYTADLLLLGVRDFPAMRDFEAEARFGNDWLLKMWDDSNGVLYYQVGIGSGNAKTYGDHDVWRLPQDDDTYGGTDPRYRYLRNRPVFRSNAPGELISPNLAGRMAAAFALCYQIWRTTDPGYANSCLTKAQHIFDLANPNPSKLTSVIPYSFYPEMEWRDDMELGAAELARALQAGTPPPGLPHSDPVFYLQRAAHWANAYITGPNGAADTLNLYDVAGVAHYELHRAITTHGSDSGLATNRAALVADLKKALDQALAQAASDPFGFGFPWSTWDTTSHGAGLSVMAAEYDALTGTNTYGRYANRWLGNILGANAWGTSFIIGTGQVWPHCPHHQLANLVGSLDGTAPQLVGAAVEGPNSITGRGSVSGTRACPPGGGDRFGEFNGSGSKFLDNVESYPTIEPAIDLTATSPLAFAWQTALGAAGSAVGPGPAVVKHAAAVTAGRTVVSLQFDDGYADQALTGPVLAAHNMGATYYVNSGAVGGPDHMTWEELADLAATGNEITGHTIDHANLKRLKAPALRHQVCDDRAAFTARGYPALSFAYPYGGYDSLAKQIVAECGYTSGRGVSGVDGRRVFAETLPPLDAYATRTPANVKSGTTLATMQAYVTEAENHGGGWVQIVFHHVCDRCDAYSVSLTDFTAFVEWLSTRGADTVVLTTADAMSAGAAPAVADGRLSA